MGQMDVWHGLEREVRAEGNRVAFAQAQTRHEALRDFPDLPAAVTAAARCRCEQRDVILGALLVESRASRHPMWSAAAILTMAPLLVSLVRRVKSAPDERNDAKSLVLTAFLEAASQIGPAKRLALRLYSETRRRVLRPRRVSLDDVFARSTHDVDAIDVDDASMEVRIDRARLALRLGAIAPAPDERPAAYAERLLPSRTGAERRRRGALLSNQRVASLADLREAFRPLTATQCTGETR